MAVNPVIFREYDIRGMVGTELTDEFAYLLGRAYAAFALKRNPSWGQVNAGNSRTIAIGRDCRTSSEGYARELARGVSEGGLDVVMTGMGPTPQAYFALFHHNLGGAIQVTGSHNPSDMNGFKLCLGSHTLSGHDIQELRQEIEAYSAHPRSAVEHCGTVSEKDIRDEYIAFLIDNGRPYFGSRKLKIVVDAGNGVGGLVGPAVLRGLGCEVIELYCEPDGRFPNHHPDPTVLENIRDLQERVRAEGADFGIGWDGDADRIGVVDEQGQVIFGDMLLFIYGREILRSEPRATIIGDVKCSNRLFQGLNDLGGNAVMWKTGHSLIKGKLRELGAALAGEMSGHIFFKHRYFGFDDALYASVRLAEIMSNWPGPASTLLSDMPPMVATPEIRVDCAEEVKFRVPELARAAFSEFKVDTIDGVRIEFDQGWGLVRASNTQPVLVMRFEASSAEKLEEYQSMVTQRISAIAERLTGKAE